MTPENVFNILSERQTRHEQKCDKRQAALHEKLDRVERHIHMALGVVLVANVSLVVLGPKLLSFLVAP